MRPNSQEQILAFCYPAVAEIKEFPRVSWLIPWQGLDIPRCLFLWACVPPVSEARNKGNLRGTGVSLEPSHRLCEG